VNKAKNVPTAFAFIRYDNDQSALRAIEENDGIYLWDNRIVVGEANKQQSYFTQDTGFITNQEFDVPKPPPPDFDSSLPANHYELKRKQELKGVSNVFSVRVDDLDPQITKEMLEDVFSQFGEVANVRRDINSFCFAFLFDRLYCFFFLF
jgi:RNA recognition motif-containing protein